MRTLPRTLWVLMAMQAFSMTAPPLVILIGGLVGARIAPSPGLATLPLAVLVLGTALSTIPASLLMRSLGRKFGFLAGNLVAIVGCLLGLVAVLQEQFGLLLLASLCLGFNMAFVNQYRFAAMEAVPEPRQGQAVSLLLLGGIFAAIVGPEAGAGGEYLLGKPYAGSFLLLALLQMVVTALIIFGFHNSRPTTTQGVAKGRTWAGLLNQPLLWLALLAGAVSYSVMSLVMTAAPLSMHEMDHHSLAMTKTAIQGHILAMFVPSLMTGWLIRRFGAFRLLMAGLAIYAAMIVAGLSGREFLNYGSSLVLLGIGWNFLFVAGTTLLPQTYQGDERYRIQAMNDFLVFGTQAVASLGAGWLLFQFGWDRLLLTTLPALLMLGVLVVWVARPIKPAPAQSEG